MNILCVEKTLLMFRFLKENAYKAYYYADVQSLSGMDLPGLTKPFLAENVKNSSGGQHCIDEGGMAI